MKNEIMQLIEQSHLRTERYSIPCIQSRLEPEDVRSQIFIAAAQFSPDAFQAFVRQNEATLKEVLSAKEVNLLKAIAADLRRSNRSLNAIKIPGQSNTAQDAVPQLTKAIQTGSGSLLMQIVAAAGGGFAVHGLTGAATGITGVLGKNVIGKMREAGMEKVSDLIKQAMLDPDLARYLLAKAPTKPGTGSSVSLAQQLRRLSMYAPTRANTSNPRNDNAGR